MPSDMSFRGRSLPGNVCRVIHIICRAGNAVKDFFSTRSQDFDAHEIFQRFEQTAVDLLAGHDDFFGALRDDRMNRV